jgi:hypothetical protein
MRSGVPSENRTTRLRTSVADSSPPLVATSTARCFPLAFSLSMVLSTVMMEDHGTPSHWHRKHIWNFDTIWTECDQGSRKALKTKMSFTLQCKKVNQNVDNKKIQLHSKYFLKCSCSILITNGCNVLSLITFNSNSLSIKVPNVFQFFHATHQSLFPVSVPPVLYLWAGDYYSCSYITACSASRYRLFPQLVPPFVQLP